MIANDLLVRFFFTHGNAAEVIEVARHCTQTRPRLIVTTNIDHIITLSENGEFRKAYNGAVARTLDGMPLVWLAWLKGYRDVQRVTGHDLLTATLCKPLSPQTRIFLICATDQVAQAIKVKFIDKGLPVESIISTVAPIGFSQDECYGRYLAEQVGAHGTTLLIIGIGAPRSEIWVERHGPIFGSPIVLAVGDALNVASGVALRAPVLMQRIGLEWFFRFAKEPQRLFWRYFMRPWKLFWLPKK